MDVDAHSFLSVCYSSSGLGFGGLLFTVLVIYCMLARQSKGKATARLASAATPLTNNIQSRGRAAFPFRVNLTTRPKRLYTDATMLRAAQQKHEQEHQAQQNVLNKSLSQSLFPSSSPPASSQQSKPPPSNRSAPAFRMFCATALQP